MAALEAANRQKVAANKKVQNTTIEICQAEVRRLAMYAASAFVKARTADLLTFEKRR